MGYTAIEMMMVLTLVGVAATLSLASYRANQPRYNLRKAGRAMISELRLIRQKAISTGKLSEIKFNPAQGSYKLFGIDERVLPPYIRFGFPHEIKKSPGGKSLSDNSHDGVTFNNNDAKFEPNGTSKGIGGTVYLTNAAIETSGPHPRGEAVAISVNITGRVRLYKWDGDSWQ